MIVVTDTSVVLNLAFLKREELLLTLFHTVLAPPQVFEEFERLAEKEQRFKGLVFPTFIQLRQAEVIPPLLVENSLLDAGERNALALALELKVDAVLIDERIAREVATQLGLHTIGVLGVLAAAKENKLVAEIRPLIDQLQSGAEFRIHPELRSRVLREAGELF